MAKVSEEKAARKVAQLEIRATRTNAQQLAMLDSRLGVGVGAKRERDRLNGIVKEKVVVEVVAEEVATEEDIQAEKDARKAAKKASKKAMK